MSRDWHQAPQVVKGRLEHEHLFNGRITDEARFRAGIEGDLYLCEGKGRRGGGVARHDKKRL